MRPLLIPVRAYRSLTLACLTYCVLSYAQLSFGQDQQKGGVSSPNPDARKPILVPQQGHAFKVVASAISPDGRFVATGSSDGELILWEAATGLERRRITGPNSLSSIAFSPDGLQLLAGGTDARSWSLDETRAEPNIIFSTAGHVNSLAFSPDGRLIFTGGRGVQVWSSAGRPLRSIDPNAVVDTIAVSPTGKSILVGGGGVRLFDIDTGTLIRAFVSRTSPTSVAFSPDGKFVATAADYVTIWDLNGQVVQVINAEKASAASFSPDGQSLLVTGNDSIVWDLAKKTALLHIPQLEPSLGIFSPDGRSLLLTEWDGPSLYDLSTGRRLRSFTGTLGIVWNISLSLSDRYILAVGDNARLWDANTGQEVRRFGSETGWVNAAAISPDGRLVLTGGERARLWDLMSGRVVRQFGGRSRDIRAVAFSPDGTLVLTGHGGSLANRHGDESADYTACLWETQTGKQVRCLNGHTDSISSVAFSHNGDWIVTGSQDRTARLWDVHTGEEKLKLSHGGWVHSVSFSTDDRFIATASDDARIWDAQTGALIWDLTLDHTVFSAQFSPDGKSLLTAGADDKAHLWDISRRTEIRSLAGHAGFVVDAIYSFDGNYILAGGGDNEIIIYRASTGERIATISSFPGNRWVAFDPDFRFDTNDLEGAGGLHWVSSGEGYQTYPLEVFMSAYYEPGLLSRLLAGEKLASIPSVVGLNRIQPAVQVKSVEWQDPQQGIALVTVMVARGVSGVDDKTAPVNSDVYDLRVLRDGQLVANIPQASNLNQTVADPEDLARWRDRTKIELPPSGPRLFSFSIQVPRKPGAKDVTFSAYAFNGDKVKSTTSVTTLSLPDKLAVRKGNAYLISVGVDQNEHSPSMTLKFAASDALRLQEAIKEKLLFSKQFENVVAVSLLSSQATKANLETIFADLAGQSHSTTSLAKDDIEEVVRAQPEDVIIFTFSGHSYLDKIGGFHLIMFDSELPDQEGSGAYQSIRSDELATWIRRIDAGDITLILDTSHSGAIVEDTFKPGPMADSTLGQLAYDKGMRILTATTAEQVAFESSNLKSGLLTYALIDSLRTDSFQDESGNFEIDIWLAAAQRNFSRIFAEFTTGGSLSSRTILQLPTLFDFSAEHKLHERGAKP